MEKYRVVANAIRGLSMDAVEKAKSGHPGAPMGMADMASVLWTEYLNVSPLNPRWENRDRFVLSNGHASMLLYSLLHLTGFNVSLDDLKSFRQLHSKTPGHPEFGETEGVETTTGPLGQGIANAVGFALAEAHLAETYNRDGFPIVDHYTYCFVGDGCLMEGISHEACSFAGTLGLGKLIVLYDSNQISIDGDVSGWFAEDVAKRFEAYGWHVVEAIDGHDYQSISQSIELAQSEKTKPSLIICKTKIGYGSPNLQGSEKSHGAPFGEQEILETKKILGISTTAFDVDKTAYKAADLKERGSLLEDEWKLLLADYQKKYPELAEEYLRVVSGDLPADFDHKVTQAVQEAQQKAETIATRKASENALNIIGPMLPELMGGSADLSGSNNTFSKVSESITHDNYAGNYLHYGVREFAMAAIMNGLQLHGGMRPYGGTFLVFSDYMRNAIRLSALMKLPVTYVLTHDSIGLGEDGPTHQPVEHVASLRLIPNLNVWRPCDSVETLVAWQQAMLAVMPNALILSRQGLPVPQRDETQLNEIKRGGYVLLEDERAQLTLIATGSEVELAINAAKELKSQGVFARVVSMPCCDVFKQQDKHYQSQVLPANQVKIAIEAGISNYWYEFVGDKGAVIAMDSFGASAPADQLFNEFGFTVDHVVHTAKELLAKN